MESTETGWERTFISATRPAEVYCERLCDAAAGDARVDEKVGIVVTDERGVAGARTGEGVKFHGMIPLYQFTEIIPQPRAIVKKKKPPAWGL